MAEIAATIIDAADIRAYECVLPDSVPVSQIAARLAELMHLPLNGPDDRPLRYGLIAKGGSLIDPDANLAEANLPCPLALRLVAELSAGADGADEATDIEAEAAEDEPEFEISVSEPAPLIHDAALETRPDVRIDAQVHKQIEEFAAANRNKEVAGLLLGKVDSEGKSRIIHLTAAIPAENAFGTKASVRISLDDWESMLKARDLEYSDLRILGWFHTHAGWGVFMSDSDVFIHRHFFPHPSMVAYVLDPTSGRDGFFFWHEGKISLCPSYGLVGSPSDVNPAAHPKQTKPAAAESPLQPKLDPKNYVIGALLVGVLYLAFVGSPLSRHHQHSSQPKSAAKVVVTKEVAKPAKDRKSKAVAPVDIRGERIYVIGPKDNPWSICNRVYNNGDLGPALMRYNGLSSVKGLQIGQKLRLPSAEVLKRMRK